MKHYIVGGKAYSYEYGEDGNISKITNPDGSYVEYQYDELGQLVDENYSSPITMTLPNGQTASIDRIGYTYDSRGNLLSKMFITAELSRIRCDYGYTDTVWKDRLTSFNGGTTITYDTIGNPTKWYDGATMTWQRGRQLATVTKDGLTYT